MIFTPHTFIELFSDANVAPEGRDRRSDVPRWNKQCLHNLACILDYEKHEAVTPLGGYPYKKDAMSGRPRFDRCYVVQLV